MQINLGDRIIDCSIVKKKRKTISIKITENGGVAVSAPLNLSNARIEELLRNKTNWIISKIDTVKASAKIRHNILEADNLKLLGEDFKLNIYDTEERVVRVLFKDKQFYVYSPKNMYSDCDMYIKEAITNWYKKQASLIYTQRAEYYSKLLNVHYNKISIKEQKTRWGSCSSKGNLNFNWRVIMAPIEIVDYLVVHELCHLVHMNHSKDFWALVGGILPNYQNHRDWLKANGNSLII